MKSYFHESSLKKLEFLKILYYLEEIKGKFIFHKTFFGYEYLRLNIGYKFERYHYGPYSYELEDDLLFLQDEGFIFINETPNQNRIFVNKGRIKKYFDQFGFDLRLNQKEGKIISQIEDLYMNELKDNERIELATSLLQIINEGKFVLQDEIFKELKIWKGSKFIDKDIIEIWNLLQLKKLIPDLIIEINQLTKIETGNKECFNYQRLISKILLNIFKADFRNMESERIAHEGYKKIDTVYTNVATDGFFKNLPEKNRKIVCNYIIVEAKNYSYDLGNREFDQLFSRLNKKVGNFGILVCRNINSMKDARKRSQSYLDDNKYILFLTDKDIIELGRLSLQNLAYQIDDFIDNKFKSLVFRY